MKTDCPITFVNTLAVSGFNNGIINLAFSTASFTPRDDDGQTIVAVDEYISANLRMDLFCAQQLHDSLAKIIAQQTKPGPTKTEVN